MKCRQYYVTIFNYAIYHMYAIKELNENYAAIIKQIMVLTNCMYYTKPVNTYYEIIQAFPVLVYSPLSKPLLNTFNTNLKLCSNVHCFTFEDDWKLAVTTQQDSPLLYGEVASIQCSVIETFKNYSQDISTYMYVWGSVVKQTHCILLWNTQSLNTSTKQPIKISLIHEVWSQG